MSDFNLKRQVSEEDNNIEKEEDEEIMLEDVTQEVTDFNLTPEYRAMGLPDHVGDVVIDDGFTFRDEPTRGIDFLKPLASSHTVPDIDSNITEPFSRTYVEPPKLPIDMSLFPLEKTHFLTNADPVQVCMEFRKAFDSNDVKINKFDLPKYKFKCEYDVEDEDGKVRERVFFRARIYTVNKDKKYVVELQRRDGCCLQWRKLYNNLKSSIPLDQIVQ